MGFLVGSPDGCTVVLVFETFTLKIKKNRSCFNSTFTTYTVWTFQFGFFSTMLKFVV